LPHSEIVPVFSRKAIFGYRQCRGINLHSFIGMSVWAHHMFTVGMNSNANTFFVSRRGIAVPTGIKIFTGWRRCGAEDSLQDADALRDRLFSFILDRRSYGDQCWLVSTVGFNWHLGNSTSWSRTSTTHRGRILFAAFAAFYYWFPKMSEKCTARRSGGYISGSSLSAFI